MGRHLMKILILVTWGYKLFSQEGNLDFSHQVNIWGTGNFQKPFACQFGARYIPDFEFKYNFTEFKSFDAEFSVNAVTAPLFTGSEYVETYKRLSPYRMWVRYSTSNWELRAGLQKINFGSATILRPLMWFDQIDPRDPLQLTDGVYGLLGRYYFNNNANIWLWCLYGNDAVKGWDYLPSNWKVPEFGGRVQLPLFSGEFATSYHHRTADYARLNTDTTITGSIYYTENKLGIDGKWDAVIGIWFEAVIKQNNPDNDYIPQWEDYLNMGLDYTFGIGNGLNSLFEFFRVNSSEKIFGQGPRSHFSALTINYPLGIINNISCILFYNWDDQGFYRFVNYQRTYDLWTFYIMAFWNPDTYSLYSAGTERNLFAGKGFQLMAVCNF